MNDYDLTAEQKIRMRAIELAAEKYKDTTVMGRPLTVNQLVSEAKAIERYIKAGVPA